MRTILISGGSGFIGSHFCDKYIADGHRVIVVDSLLTGRRANIEHLLENDRFTFIEHDVTEPFELPVNIDRILHLASPASPPDFKRIPLETLKAGSYGTHVMLELAREKGARFLLARTSEIYGDPPAEHHPQKEEYWGNVNTIGDRSVYDEAKRYAEAVTMAYGRDFGVQTRIVRIFNTYGPRMHKDDGRVVTNFVTQALTGSPITLHGDGSQTRSFSYVSDTVDGLHRLIESDEMMPVNIGNPDEFTIRELAEVILKMTDSKSEIVFEPQPFNDDPKQRRPDISKAKRVLGWEPKVSLEEGLRRTIDYLRQEIEV